MWIKLKYVSFRREFPRFHQSLFQLLVIVAYLSITLGMTYPVVFHLADQIPSAFPDAPLNYWNLWWFKTAIVDLGINPTYTKHLFAPIGTSLGAHTTAPFHGLVGIPLQILFGLPAAFGLIYLSTFVLSAYGMYLLIYYLTKNYTSSFLAALIFAFSPYHMLHARYHLNLMAIQFIPLFALCVIKLAEKPGFKYGISSGIFLGLIALCDWNYFVFAVIFFFIYWVLVYVNERAKSTNPDFLRSISLMGVVGLLIASPFLIPLVKDVLFGATSLLEEGGARGYSADLAAFFIPSNLHPLWGKSAYITQLYSTLSGGVSEGTVFLG